MTSRYYLPIVAAAIVLLNISTAAAQGGLHPLAMAAAPGPPTKSVEAVKKALLKLKGTMKDPAAQLRLQGIIDKLSTYEDIDAVRAVADTIGDERVKGELNSMIDELQGSAEKALQLSGDLLLKPTHAAGDAVISPAITANYDMHDTVNGGFFNETRIGYNVHFELQSASSSADTITLLRNLLSSGSDGRIELSFRAGLGDTWKAGFRLNANAGLSWVGGRSVDTSVITGFAYGTGSVSLTAWLNPLYAGLAFEAHGVSVQSRNALTRELNGAWAVNANIVLKLQNDLFLQASYLLDTNRPITSGESFQMRFVKSFSPF
ncbi:MAG: hypothetical protein JST22_10410 [Bacteroidetes bacterium]|nr:hypothetical protein [Bacteroidota bacterium]